MSKRKANVDRPKFEQAICTAEANGPLRGAGALYKVVTDLYNRGEPPKRISRALTKAKIEEWEITTQTKIRKRVKVEPKEEVVFRDPHPEDLPALAGTTEMGLTRRQHGKRIMRLGEDRARVLLGQARRRKEWGHVDWDYVETQLAVLDQ